jgi:hypothetical protein
MLDIEGEGAGEEEDEDEEDFFSSLLSAALRLGLIEAEDN